MNDVEMDLDEIIRKYDAAAFIGLGGPVANPKEIPKCIRYIWAWHDGGTEKIWGYYTFHSYQSSESKRKEAIKSFIKGGPIGTAILLIYCPFMLWSNPIFECNGDGYYISRWSGRIRYFFNHEWPKSFNSSLGFWRHIKQVTAGINNNYASSNTAQCEAASIDECINI
jgi:hypothetical protein